MEAYRYQQLAYLLIPVLLGCEFFISAKDEKRGGQETPLGSYVLDFLGFLFIALIPALFLFTVWAVETRAFPTQKLMLARFDRYGVLFLFFGAWWQVHMIGALRARRTAQQERTKWYHWGPFLFLGAYISFLILWASPFNMKWGSAGWFVAVFGASMLLRLKAKTVERVQWALAAFIFLVENAVFIFLETVV